MGIFGFLSAWLQWMILTHKYNSSVLLWYVWKLKPPRTIHQNCQLANLESKEIKSFSSSKQASNQVNFVKILLVVSLFNEMWEEATFATKKVSHHFVADGHFWSKKFLLKFCSESSRYAALSIQSMGQHLQ